MQYRLVSFATVLTYIDADPSNKDHLAISDVYQEDILY